MQEQIELPDSEQSINYLPSLANNLKNHCKQWNYDWLERLEPKSAENFLKLFCKITCTYFFEYKDGYYGAEFAKKDKTVRIYKCGKGFTGETLAEYNIEELLIEL